jgi:Flp pilus assembly protein TadG
MDKIGKNNKEQRVTDGYLTTEAAMVMPLLLAGIVFTLYLGFYLYNVCLVRETAYTAALRGSLEQDMGTAALKDYTEKQLDELLSGRLLAASAAEKEVKVSLTRVTVRVSLSMDMPFSAFISPLTRLWTYTATASAKRLRPTAILRAKHLTD